MPLLRAIQSLALTKMVLNKSFGLKNKYFLKSFSGLFFFAKKLSNRHE